MQALNFMTPYYIIKKDPADISIDDIERAPSQTLEWNGALPDLVDDRHQIIAVPPDLPDDMQSPLVSDGGALRRVRRASTHRKRFSRCRSAAREAAREATDRFLTAERVVLTAGVRTMPSLNVLQRMQIGNQALMFRARLCCCLIILCTSGSCANAHGVQSRVINARFMNFASRRGRCRYAGGVHSRYVCRVHSRGSSRNGLCCIVSLFCGRPHTQCSTDTRTQRTERW